ncbi:hypothetical protein ACR71G_16275 [Xenorhabdus bovienii]|uniref:hypothetical protein n=1 Tax=Xenorhabdus bovienii TaxID=40576 RepID=UPI003DA62614
MSRQIKNKPICDDFRTVVSVFLYLHTNDNPHVAKLFELKSASEYIPISDVPGCANSLIEKMTHPVSYKKPYEYFSPYLISLFSSDDMIDILLDCFKSKYDYVFFQHMKEELHSQYITIKRFYFRNTTNLIRKIQLCGRQFLEQRPTKPYFENQKIITPDLTVYRKNENIYRLLLSKAVKRPVSISARLALNATLRYANDVQKKETERMLSGELTNNTTYFCEMYDYLNKYADVSDFISQSSLENSSDKNIVHFQFVHGVSLPLFRRGSKNIPPFNIFRLDWYLPTVLISFDFHEVEYQKNMRELQRVCMNFSAVSQISITPIFRKVNHEMLDIYLILKKNFSASWKMDQSVIDNAPGWLESCGVFMSGSRQARVFEIIGPSDYYENHCPPNEYINNFIMNVSGIFKSNYKKINNPIFDDASIINRL